MSFPTLNLGHGLTLRRKPKMVNQGTAELEQNTTEPHTHTHSVECDPSSPAQEPTDQ